MILLGSAVLEGNCVMFGRPVPASGPGVVAVAAVGGLILVNTGGTDTHAGVIPMSSLALSFVRHQLQHLVIEIKSLVAEL